MRIILTAAFLLGWGCEAPDELGAEGADAAVAADLGTDGGTDGLLDGAVRDGGVTCVPPAPPTACPDPPVRYDDIRPILDARCVRCHDTVQGGPWPLATYTHVADWQDIIRASMLDCTMPPLDAGVPMTTEERLTVLTWIRCGAPR